MIKIKNNRVLEFTLLLAFLVIFSGCALINKKTSENVMPNNCENITDEEIAELENEYESLFLEEVGNDSLMSDINILQETIVEHEGDLEPLPIPQGLVDNSGMIDGINVKYNRLVEEYIDYFANRIHNRFQMWIDRSGYYEDMIKSELRKANLPEGLFYLAMIESGFSTKAYSTAKALGIWQFISGTGVLYGLKANKYIDERKDPFKSTQAAIKYLSKLYNQFGDWELAIASYNVGEGRIDREIKRTGNRDYWSMRLPQETKHYIPKFYAAIIIMKNLEKYGFEKSTKKGYPEFEEIVVDKRVNLKKISENSGCDFEDLAFLNAELRTTIVPSNYTLRVPKGKKEDVLLCLNDLPEEKDINFCKHKVKKGESLESIAKYYNVSLASLKKINKLKSDKVKKGMKLIIPVNELDSYNDVAVKDKERKEDKKEINTNKDNNEKKDEQRDDLVKYVVKKGDTLNKIAMRHNMTIAEIKEINNLKRNYVKSNQVILVKAIENNENNSNNITNDLASNKEKNNNTEKYIVAKGDNIFRIAKKFDLTVEELKELNSLKSNNIKVGQTLLVKADKVNSKEIEKEIVADLAKNTDKTNKKEKESKNDITLNNKTEKNNSKSYTVKPGDTIYSIAKKNNLTVDELKSINGLTSDEIKVNQQLLLVKNSNSRNKNDNIKSSNLVYYTVQKGDNLWKISQKFGVDQKDIQRLNKLNDIKSLRPGAKIKIAR